MPLAREWFYFSAWHTVVVRSVGGTAYFGLDLTTGKVYPYPGSATDTQEFCRVRPACAEAAKFAKELPQLPIVNGDMPAPLRCPYLQLKPTTGTLVLGGVHPPWPPFVPQSDGQPVLMHASLLQAWHRHLTLAALSRHRDSGLGAILRLIHGPEGVPIFEHQGFRQGAALALSPDGQRVAFQIGKRRLKVGKVSGDGGYYLVTFEAGKQKD